jgi:hypothetical protein
VTENKYLPKKLFIYLASILTLDVQVDNN